MLFGARTFSWSPFCERVHTANGNEYLFVGALGGSRHCDTRDVIHKHVTEYRRVPMNCVIVTLRHFICARFAF